MSEKFRNRFRISTSRARWWDYGNGSYFVTICTRDRIHFFGEIIDHKFFHSKIGEMAEKYWNEIPGRFPHVKLGAFVTMPNHIHGIINIRNSPIDILDIIDISDPIDIPDVIDIPDGIEISDVQTRFIASPPDHEDHHENQSKSIPGGVTGIHNPMLHQNLSRVIRWYTGRVSYEAHKINPDFDWQKRFNDRIIRDAEEYKIKTRYILQNPLNWKEDEFFRSPL